MSFDDKTRLMLSKAIDDLSTMAKFQEEFIGLLHQMVLDLYKQNNLELPEYFHSYQFKNKNPWSNRLD